MRVEEVASAYFREPIRQLGVRERNFDVLVAVRAYFSLQSVASEPCFKCCYYFIRRCGRSAKEPRVCHIRTYSLPEMDLSEALRALRAYSVHDIPQPETVELQLKYLSVYKDEKSLPACCFETRQRSCACLIRETYINNERWTLART